MTRHSVISGFFLFLPWKPPNFASLAWVNLLGPSSCGCTIVLYFSLLCFHTCLFFLLTDCLVFQLCAFLSSCFFVSFFFFHSVSLLHVFLLLMQLRLLVQTLSAKESNVGGTAGLLLLSSFSVSAKLCKSGRAAHERSGETRLPEERELKDREQHRPLCSLGNKKMLLSDLALELFLYLAYKGFKTKSSQLLTMKWCYLGPNPIQTHFQARGRRQRCKRRCQRRCRRRWCFEVFNVFLQSWISWISWISLISLSVFLCVCLSDLLSALLCFSPLSSLKSLDGLGWKEFKETLERDVKKNLGGLGKLSFLRVSDVQPLFFVDGPPQKPCRKLHEGQQCDLFQHSP